MVSGRTSPSNFDRLSFHFEGVSEVAAQQNNLRSKGIQPASHRDAALGRKKAHTVGIRIPLGMRPKYL